MENAYTAARREAAKRGGLVDLIDTNFHSCGFRYPRDVIAELIQSYLSKDLPYDPDPAGEAELRQEIASYYSALGVPATAGRLVITSSASESYSHIFASQSRSGDRVLLPRPGYPIFEDLAVRTGLEIDFYDQRRDAEWSPDPDQIRTLMHSRTMALVLISPNNPTGAVADEHIITALGRICREHDAFLVSDEVFSEFLFARNMATLPRPAALLQDVATFTINGASKLFASPDLKVSWIVVSGPRRDQARITEDLLLQNDLFLSSAPLTQAVVAGLFRHGMGFTRAMVDAVSARRRTMLEEIDNTPWLRALPPAGGIHIPVEVDREAVPAEYDDEALAVELLAAGVAVHPGYLYGFDEPPTLVMSYLSPEARIREGFARIRAFFSDL